MGFFILDPGQRHAVETIGIEGMLTGWYGGQRLEWMGSVSPRRIRVQPSAPTYER